MSDEWNDEPDENPIGDILASIEARLGVLMACLGVDQPRESGVSFKIDPAQNRVWRVTRRPVSNGTDYVEEEEEILE